MDYAHLKLEFKLTIYILFKILVIIYGKKENHKEKNNKK